MGKMYHGSPKKLESIDLQDRYAYSDEKPVVFATPERTHAISYIAPWSDDDFVHKTVSGDPALHMEEKYPGAFEKLYKGRKGYLYELDPSSFSKYRGEEFTSTESPEILSSEEIDLYEAMLAEEAAGRLKLHRAKEKTASEQDFAPDFTPAQLKELGVYDQVYGDAPSEASMKEWPEHWINKQDPLGWLQWYDRYSEGRRTDDDSRQIKRWKSFKARHLAQYAKNPTPRRAAALRNWGIDVSKSNKTASAQYRPRGTLILRNDKGQVYAGKADRPGVSPYYFPGGGIFEGEGVDRVPTAAELEEGMNREALEELGYAIKNYKPLANLQRTYSKEWQDKAEKKRGVRYLGENEYYATAELGDEDKSLYDVEGDAFTSGGWYDPLVVAKALEEGDPTSTFYDSNLEEAAMLRELQLKTASAKDAENSLKEAIKTAAKGTATKRDPKKWSAAKSRAKAKMGGKWSARAAQLAVKYYKGSGGTYSGKKPTKKNNKLKKWTKEDWGYRPGSKAQKDSKKSPSSGTKGRYLPKKKWQSLSKSEQKATDAKKKKGMKKGKGVVSNTAKAKYDSKKDYTKKSALLDAIQTLQYPEKVAPQFQGYISQKRTKLTTLISDLPQPPHPENDSEETRNELLVIKMHMEEGKLPESLMILADREPEKIFHIACEKFGIDPKKEQASEIKEDFNKIAFDLKYIFKRPRPWSLAEHHGVNLNVTIPESADTPSYPSGHAMMGYGLAEFYKSHYPEYTKQWDKIADIIQHSRLQAGLHFPSDNAYSKQIVDEVSSREKVAIFFGEEAVLGGLVGGALAGENNRTLGAAAGAGVTSALGWALMPYVTQPLIREIASDKVKKRIDKLDKSKNMDLIDSIKGKSKATYDVVTGDINPTVSTKDLGKGILSAYARSLPITLGAAALTGLGVRYKDDIMNMFKNTEKTASKAKLIGALGLGAGAGVGGSAILNKDLKDPEETERLLREEDKFERLRDAGRISESDYLKIMKDRAEHGELALPEDRYYMGDETSEEALARNILERSQALNSSEKYAMLLKEAGIIQDTVRGAKAVGSRVRASAAQRAQQARAYAGEQAARARGYAGEQAARARGYAGEQAARGKEYIKGLDSKYLPKDMYKGDIGYFNPYVTGGFVGAGAGALQAKNNKLEAALGGAITGAAINRLVGVRVGNVLGEKFKGVSEAGSKLLRETAAARQAAKAEAAAAAQAAGEAQTTGGRLFGGLRRALNPVETAKDGVGSAVSSAGNAIADGGISLGQNILGRVNPYTAGFAGSVAGRGLITGAAAIPGATMVGHIISGDEKRAEAKDDHVEKRRKERAPHVSKKKIDKLKDSITNAGKKIPKGDHHVRLNNASAVVKDTGKKHVLSTILGPNMKAPGKDLSKTNLLKAALAADTLTNVAVAGSVLL